MISRHKVNIVKKFMLCWHLSLCIFYALPKGYLCLFRAKPHTTDAEILLLFFQDFSSEVSGKLSSKLFSFWSKSESQSSGIPKSNSPHPLRKSRIDRSVKNSLTSSKLESVSTGSVLGHGHHHQFHHHGLGHPSRSPFQLNGMCRADQTTAASSSSTKPTSSWMVSPNQSFLPNHQLRNQNQG